MTFDVPAISITPAPTDTQYDPTAIGQVDYFPFVVGKVFVSGVSAFLSLTIILAITLPLLKKKQREKVCTYNLYLVFSAIPDLVYNLFFIYVFSTYKSWITVVSVGEVPWIDHPFDIAMFASCAAANLYINVIIAYEILKLLRNCKRCQRCRAPTLPKVCLQALCGYAIAAAVFVVDYFDDDLKNTLPLWVYELMFLPVAIFIPIGIVFCICIQIYCEGLIGDFSSEAGKRLTVLVKYFARIIGFYFFWIPSVIFYIAPFLDEEKKGFYYYLGGMIYAIGSWINFALCLTKPDVLKNVLDLLSGKAFRSDSRKKIDRPTRFVVGGNSDDKHAAVRVKHPNDECPKSEHASNNMHSVDSDDADTNVSNKEEEEINSNIFDFSAAVDPITSHV